TIVVRCKPAQIPEKIEVDVSGLHVAESLHVSDVKAPPGIKFITPPTQTVAVVAIPEKLEEVVKPAAAVPGVEGAAAVAGAGTGAAAPAAGAEAKPGEAKPGEAKPAAAAPAKETGKGPKK